MRFIKVLYAIEKEQAWKSWPMYALFDEIVWLILALMILLLVFVGMCAGFCYPISCASFLMILANVITVPVYICDLLSELPLLVVALIIALAHLYVRVRTICYDLTKTKFNCTLVLDCLVTTYIPLAVLPVVFWSGFQS